MKKNYRFLDRRTMPGAGMRASSLAFELWKVFA
jgi:hypothetical protein